VVVEFDYPNLDDAMFTIIQFLDEQGFGEWTEVEIHAIGQRHRFTAPFRDLKDTERLTALIGVSEMSQKRLNRLIKRLLERL
jgi:hypothetical protein